MKTWRLGALLALLAVLAGMPRAQAAQQVEAVLEGRAVLPALTFAPGPISGTLLGSGPINGVALPFASQPVQGVSGVLDAGDGSFWILEDNGYGAKNNSADFLLRLYRVHPDFETAEGGSGTVEVGKFIQLRDPFHKVPFTIVNAGTSDRLLTGADFDIESVRRDRKGDFWFGDEFGPFLLHTDSKGRVLEAPIPLPGVFSPDSPYLGAQTATLPRSRGFEGMAISANRRTLYPMLEGALIADPDQRRRLIYEYDLIHHRYTGVTHQYRMDDATFAIGDFTRLDGRRFMVIERDNNQGAAARFKRIFVVDLRVRDAEGFLVKTPLVDLMRVRDPAGISLPGRPGDLGLGDPFSFPFVTIESVLPLDDHRLLVINDNNFPFSLGRNPQLPDDTEFIVLSLEPVLVPEVAASFILPDRPLADAVNSVLPGTIDNDRGFLLGGIGSDLWRGEHDLPNEFWMIADRGPNGQVSVAGQTRRTFPVPTYTPLILHVCLNPETGAIDTYETIPIVGQSGAPVTGLSNLARDEPPYDFAGQTLLGLNQSGLDTEGLVRTSAGEFWVNEEYGPSLVHIGADGKVIKRYSPTGVALPEADYPTAESLPGIFTKRKVNRGFEGLALSKDEHTLYLVLQSPLANPSRAVGDPSRNTRILVFDIPSERVVAEYVYRFEVSATFDPSLPNPTEMKLSGVIALSDTQLLVLERTDNVAKVYRVDLSKATNILGSKWDDPATAPSLEALADPASEGVVVLPKTLVVDLAALPGVPGKIEGIAVIDDTTLAIANDNDFDIGTIVGGVNQGTGAPSKVLIIKDVPLYP